ncbi:hypothetical protein EDD37DRAFT_639616 [Exophiala viscosa]|uniref:uncharacterized protein n=1 Tax=Exophiala viscosa TaxID=2486360 RepID=UPI00218DFFA0|nr:hypothetical protein EDD37DRAFT_639616 [Exophiala viscosa]
MRLQLLIQRHAFPPVHIIYTTGAGPASHTRSRDSTIADLLNDVNDIVPLESADGEWGLEDYAVEVAATADQSSLYECLHYQTCESVLREDDEVIIRALTSEDLRVRRLGGRHQITGDGRHLVDGIPFGKQWLRRTNRPGIVIPPRKKRRLLAEEPNSDDDEKVKQILPAESEEDYTGALVPFISDDEEEDEDDEEDEDFVEEEEPDQVTLREDFDDADAESDHDEEEAGDGLDDEVKVLLRDAEDIASAGGGAAARSVFERRLKRKRDIDDEGQPYEDDTFEGFSTPAKSPRKGIIDNDDKASADSDEDSMMADIATRQAEKRALNVVDDDEDLDEDEEDSDFNSLDSNTGEDRRAPTKDEKDEEPDTDSSSDVETSSSGSEADSMLDKLAMEQAKKRALNLVNASGSDLLEDSEADEDFSTPQAEEVAQQVVDGTSSSSSESDTSSESEEDSESDSELSESDSESEDDEEKGREGRKAVPDSLPAPLPTTKVSATDLQFNQSPATSAPGQGMARTHRNNDRVKKRKRLEALKMQGLLPANADFKALAEYDEQGQNQGAVDVDQAEAAVNEPEVERNVVAETIVDAEMTGPDETADITTHEVVDDKRVEDIGMTANLIVACSAEVPKTAPNKEAGTVTEPAPKRARLDLASSRRMLFSSLGLRTPKTPEAEQALREKLSKSIRPTKQVAGPINGVESSTGQPHALMEDEDSWKDKLVVSAVECEEYVGPMEPPPFPFKQGWTKPARDGNKKKRQSRDQSQYYQSRDEQDPTSNDQDFAPDVSTLGTDEETKPTPNTGTKAPETASTTPSGISLPTDFQTLPALTQENIRPGAVIAYQELHVDASTSWQPEISTYRVGDISHLDQDGTIHVKLDPSSLKPKLEVSTEDTEESKTYGFELEGEDKSQEDDGIREIQFSDMISAKLVKASSVEVPESSHVNGVGLRGGDASASSNGDHFAVIPESAEQDSTSQAPIQPQISVEDIATPRRNEISVIIKEAGFNSALDEQLLQPNMNSTQFRQSASASGEVDEGTTYTSRKRSPLLDFVPSEDQQSSVVDENDWHLHEEGPDANFDSEPPISSPYVHTQESVEYPHISQMALNSSGVVQTNTSSSHQDAQKLPLTPVVDLAFTISAQETSVSQAAENEVELETKSELVDEEESEDQGNASGEDEPDDDSEYQDSSAPLKSEVSQSQLLDAYEGISQEPRSQRDSSFLGGLGHDGHDSSYHDDDDDEDVDGNSDNNSDDLPSLRELTSSQQVRVQTRSISKKVSPPATRKSRRKSDRIKSSTPPSSPELPPSSQPEPKLSQSEEPRMSQIPIGSKIVDLTQSSDGSSPIKGDDGFYSTKTRTRAQVNGHRNSQGSAARKVSGLGTKRLLTTKKSRNYF